MTQPDRDLTLPSGGTIRWRDIETLLGADQEAVADIAWRIKKQDTPTRRDVLIASIAVLVESWNIPYLPGAPEPRDNPDLISQLRLPDYKRLYAAGAELTDLAFADEPGADDNDPGAPGSPTVPGTGSEPN